ncbi:SCO family protein [Achromobacter aloeverae]
MPITTAGDTRAAPRRRGALTVLIVFLVSLAPVVAAVVFYLNPQWWPRDGSNYGALVEPQRDLPGPAQLPLATLDGQPYDLRQLRGKWLLMAADGGACPESCARKLFIIRNTHASQGKNVDRVARVWFITDDAEVPRKVLDAYVGTVMVRARPEQLAAFLLDAGAGSGKGNGTGGGADEAAAAGALAGPMWLVDPLGHLMLRFPPDADPVKVRSDLSKLIYNSRIG